MSEKVRKNPPYANTSVPCEKTKAKIDSLLRSYGVEEVVWANIAGDEALVFRINAEIMRVKRKITIQIKPPHIVLNKRGGYGRGIVHTENRNQAWRLVFYWIKSKIEAVMWGLSTIEKEFLSEVMVSLPDGKTSSVGEVVLNLVAEDRLKSLPFIEEKKNDLKTVDVER